MTTIDTPALLPCPFCGGEAEIDGTTWRPSNGKEVCWVTCMSCNAYGPTFATPEAIAAWNCRATLTPAAPTDNTAPVKALEWHSAGYDGQSLEASALGLEVFYRIDGRPGNWTLTSPGATAYVHAPGYDTRASAQAAAMDDYVSRIRAALASREAAAPADPVAWTDADAAWRDLCEKDDRTSPDDQPDMCLITREELAAYMAAPAAQPADHALTPAPAQEPFPKPTWAPAKSPCGECHLRVGETCDVCGASNPAPAQASDGDAE